MKNYCIFDEISQIIIGNDSENCCHFRLFLNIFDTFQRESSKDATFVTDFFSENSWIFSVYCWKLTIMDSLKSRVLKTTLEKISV